MPNDKDINSILKRLRPETDLEREMILRPEVQEGLLWGTPRFGHPEGKVLYHVEEVYQNIDALHQVDVVSRERLRLTALLHDSFKYLEIKTTPRDWNLHHGRLARSFAEPYIHDVVVLDLLELHDEAYYCWRASRNLPYDQIDAQHTIETLYQRVEPFLLEYMLFFRCDTLTGDKNLAPLGWFESEIEQMVSKRSQ